MCFLKAALCNLSGFGEPAPKYSCECNSDGCDSQINMHSSSAHKSDVSPQRHHSQASQKTNASQGGSQQDKNVAVCKL